MKSLILHNNILGITTTSIFLVICGLFLGSLPKPDAYYASSVCLAALTGVLFYLRHCNQRIREETNRSACLSRGA